MTSGNNCKNCGRTIPVNFKYKKCESCRNKTIQGFKKIGKLLGSVAVTTVPIVLSKLFGGKDKS